MSEETPAQEWAYEYDTVLIWTSADGERVVYNGDPSDMTFQQIWDMQKNTGLNGLGPIMDALSEMNAPALMAMLYALRKVDEPKLQFADLGRVKFSQIELERRPEEDPKDPDPSSQEGETSPDETSKQPTPLSATTSDSDPTTLSA